MKTRLLPDLPVDVVTRLYKAFLENIIRIALQAPCHQHFIYYTGGSSRHPFLNQFQSRFCLRRQRGKDLGERMFHAFKNLSRKGFHKIIIVGSDCLTLTPCDVQSAFRKLDQYDCVLGPSKDGGYYLVGLNKPNKNIFRNIPWGTSVVLKKTLQRLHSLRTRVSLLRPQQDIDTFADIKRLVKSHSPMLSALKLVFFLFLWHI